MLRGSNDISVVQMLLVMSDQAAPGHLDVDPRHVVPPVDELVDLLLENERGVERRRTLVAGNLDNRLAALFLVGVWLRLSVGHLHGGIEAVILHLPEA